MNKNVLIKVIIAFIVLVCFLIYLFSNRSESTYINSSNPEAQNISIDYARNSTDRAIFINSLFE